MTWNQLDKISHTASVDANLEYLHLDTHMVSDYFRIGAIRDNKEIPLGNNMKAGRVHRPPHPLVM